VIGWLPLAATALAASAAPAGVVGVPTIACPSDGQQGPQPAPRPRGAVVHLPPDKAAQLAFYASEGVGVLAPRGWNCLEISGSNGSFLIVTPERHGFEDARDLGGSAVVLSITFGGTSGRFAVARAIARLFPQQMAFANQVAAEGIVDPLPSGPHPDDRLQRLSDNMVGFTTPAGKRGLGTDYWLAPDDDPVEGLVMLIGSEEPNLLQVSVRLPPWQREVAPSIIDLFRTGLGSASPPVD
jgi:hypothetical protein